MGMSTYIITGRIPDQENETHHIKAKCLEDAISVFIKEIYVNLGENLPFADPDIERRTIVKDWGVAVYIDSVDETFSEVKSHITGEMACSDEAKKYEERKTAYEK